MNTPQPFLAGAMDDIERDSATAAGERAAFEAAYREHHPAVLRILQRRLGNEQDADDLAQETYIRAWRYRNRDPESLKAVLFRIAINLAFSRGRQDRTHNTAGTVAVDDLDLEADELPVDEQVAHDEQMSLIVAAVETLPERCRQVFVLSRFHGLRHREIAERCRISTSMVDQHITRALALIRERVGETTR
ncbi:sigma-70 family RNA polymerase sigma factor [Flagellatimonas centrodinii]|uniref:RNA polymerase sigma factor n=1 Tax=Flagellatimonas centrodinii TaxID=2806210 RepID=UPI001FF008C5|nr:sigma-70 family RNA polymerase sigma factor [Flagellatimonas centrodinii]ULQ47270.1 sigma-70 family RNA polymerase sigma factor [Flagellatimonas centrodinii]